MRFELYDENAATEEVQRFLHVISDRRHEEIPRIAIDGIYGEETREAVREFQKIYGLYESGTVDRETFDLLNEIYLDILLREDAEDVIITTNPFPLSLGSEGNEVLVLNVMLIELEKTYKDIGSVRKSSYYSTETENAVTNLQRIFRARENGVVDELFYDRLRDELVFIKLLDAEYD